MANIYYGETPVTFTAPGEVCTLKCGGHIVTQEIAIDCHADNSGACRTSWITNGADATQEKVHIVEGERLTLNCEDKVMPSDVKIQECVTDFVDDRKIYSLPGMTWSEYRASGFNKLGITYLNRDNFSGVGLTGEDILSNVVVSNDNGYGRASIYRNFNLDRLQGATYDQLVGGEGYQYDTIPCSFWYNKATETMEYCTGFKFSECTSLDNSTKVLDVWVGGDGKLYPYFVDTEQFITTSWDGNMTPDTVVAGSIIGIANCFFYIDTAQVNFHPLNYSENAFNYDLWLAVPAVGTNLYYSTSVDGLVKVTYEGRSCFLRKSDGNFVLDGEKITPNEEYTTYTELPIEEFWVCYYDAPVYSYQFMTGQSWNDWVDSKYNTDGLYVDDEGYVRDNYIMSNDSYIYIKDSSNRVRGTDTIIAGESYSAPT